MYMYIFFPSHLLSLLCAVCGMRLWLTLVAAANQVGKVGESLVAVVALAAAEEDLRVFLHGDALLSKNGRWHNQVIALVSGRRHRRRVEGTVTKWRRCRSNEPSVRGFLLLCSLLTLQSINSLWYEQHRTYSWDHNTLHSSNLFF